MTERTITGNLTVSIETDVEDVDALMGRVSAGLENVEVCCFGMDFKELPMERESDVIPVEHWRALSLLDTTRDPLYVLSNSGVKYRAEYKVESRTHLLALLNDPDRIVGILSSGKAAAEVSPVLTEYSVKVRVPEYNDYDVVISARSEEEAVELATLHGIGAGAYEVDCWGMDGALGENFVQSSGLANT
jgi:hypothetical protein